MRIVIDLKPWKKVFVIPFPEGHCLPIITVLVMSFMGDLIHFLTSTCISKVFPRNHLYYLLVSLEISLMAVSFCFMILESRCLEIIMQTLNYSSRHLLHLTQFYQLFRGWTKEHEKKPKIDAAVRTFSCETRDEQIDITRLFLVLYVFFPFLTVLLHDILEGSLRTRMLHKTLDSFPLQSWVHSRWAPSSSNSWSSYSMMMEVSSLIFSQDSLSVNYRPKKSSTLLALDLFRELVFL